MAVPVQDKRPCGEHIRPGGGKLPAAAQLGPHPGQHLGVVKGLGDEIVRPQLEHVHPVVHPHLGGGHDNGHGLAPADAGDELLPGQAREHQVQHNQVIVVFFRPKQGLAAGKGGAAGIARPLQNGAQQAVDVGVVLHDQNVGVFHGGSPINSGIAALSAVQAPLRG